MRQDLRALDVLRNNAAMIGGVVGAEDGFFRGKKSKKDDYYFLDRPSLNLQDLTF